MVATVLTACGIETSLELISSFSPAGIVATVLTACGIETLLKVLALMLRLYQVATVLTACGIETLFSPPLYVWLSLQLQQCLPLAVLKLSLAFTFTLDFFICCNSAYRLRY